jgi:molybdenum cofactor cytidylyltransferase
MQPKEKGIYGLISSAGFSSRMKEFKPFMTYDNLPFLLSIILKLQSICQQVCIVTGFRAGELKEQTQRWLDGNPPEHWLKKNNISQSEWDLAAQDIKFCYNPHYTTGMFTSLQTGLKELQNVNWVLYHFVDQPHIPSRFYPSFAEQIHPDFEWIQPTYRGQKGHPIILGTGIIQRILQQDPDEKLNVLVSKLHPSIKYWECTFPEILKDFDRKRDIINYEKPSGNIQ